VIQDKQDLDVSFIIFLLSNLYRQTGSKKPLSSWIKMMSWISLWSRVVETQGASKSLHTC